jgi:hypothetical protein
MCTGAVGPCRPVRGPEPPAAEIRTLVAADLPTEAPRDDPNLQGMYL